MGKALSDFRLHPQPLAPGAAMDAHRRLGPGQPDGLSVDFQMIGAWMVSGHQSATGTLGRGEGGRGDRSPTGPEFDSCAVSHFCPLLPCTTVTMAALSFPDWLCDHNGYFWVSTALM